MRVKVGGFRCAVPERPRRNPQSGSTRAIKLYRQASGVGLKEAKDFVEAAAESRCLSVAATQLTNPAIKV
jgi:hypothetical protein